MERLVQEWHLSSHTQSPQAAILGVTPEIVNMNWAGITEVTAFDNSPEMIRHLFIPPRHLHATAICANWLSLPLREASCNVVAGDGSFVLLSFPGEYRQLGEELARILAPGGILVIRLFGLPGDEDHVEMLFDDLWAGRISSFNVFKWRLLMALQESPETGICVGEAWKVWNAHVPSPEKLAAYLGWQLPVIRMIDKYRDDAATRYTYPRVDDLCRILAPDFYLTDRIVPSYEDGERYPTLCFKRL